MTPTYNDQNHHNLAIGHCNIQGGLTNLGKTTHLTQLIRNHKLDILALNELNLNDTIHTSTLNIPSSFNLLRFDRPNSSRGGCGALYPANYRSPRTRANSSELARTRANSARIRQQFADTHTPANSAERSPEYAERSPEFARVRPSSRVLRRELANGSPENSFAGRNLNQRSPRTRSAANVVRRERGSSRTTFAANDNFGELVRQKLLENADYSSL